MRLATSTTGKGFALSKGRRACFQFGYALLRYCTDNKTSWQCIGETGPVCRKQTGKFPSVSLPFSNKSASASSKRHPQGTPGLCSVRGSNSLRSRSSVALLPAAHSGLLLLDHKLLLVAALLLLLHIHKSSGSRAVPLAAAALAIVPIHRWNLWATRWSGDCASACPKGPSVFRVLLSS